jgi:hypothetical protein
LIDENFWNRKMGDWRNEEQQIQMTLDGLKEANSGDRLLSAKTTLELANKAHFLYVTQNPAEQAKLLKLVLLNCGIDAKYLSYIQKAIRFDPPEGEKSRMVGERAFEPPTPWSRTRFAQFDLSHPDSITCKLFMLHEISANVLKSVEAR